MLGGAENLEGLKALEHGYLDKLNASIHRNSLLEQGISRRRIAAIFSANPVR
jgi:hypothetical protein